MNRAVTVTPNYTLMARKRYRRNSCQNPDAEETHWFHGDGHPTGVENFR